MTTDEAIAKLNAISRDDQEAAHADADDILISWMESNGGADVAAAWYRCKKRVGGFWYA